MGKFVHWARELDWCAPTPAFWHFVAIFVTRRLHPLFEPLARVKPQTAFELFPPVISSSQPTIGKRIALSSVSQLGNGDYDRKTDGTAV